MSLPFDRVKRLGDSVVGQFAGSMIACGDTEESSRGRQGARRTPPMAPYGAALSPPRGLPRVPGSMVIAQTDPLPSLTQPSCARAGDLLDPGAMLSVRDLEEHRTALTGHCYRAMGSAADA